MNEANHIFLKVYDFISSGQSSLRCSFCSKMSLAVIFYNIRQVGMRVCESCFCKSLADNECKWNFTAEKFFKSTSLRLCGGCSSEKVSGIFQVFSHGQVKYFPICSDCLMATSQRIDLLEMMLVLLKK